MLALARITLRALFCAIKNYGRYPRWIGLATRRTTAIDLLQYAIKKVERSNDPWLKDNPGFLRDFRMSVGKVSDYLCDAETML